jgi:glycosyltransferase involved in cell wall biosynthesis/Flp pilus assembly protein TadD
MNADSKIVKSSPAISACMIVRNEEKFLAKCLESIRDYVDEIIIVDTGSTDRTVEIAESFGARIYHHPWEDHFSKHRNQSFSYAKNEWILYIDADEEILPGGGEILKKTIIDAEDDVDAIAVTLECIFNQGRSMSYNNAVRLFRNHRGFYYKGRVHNYIIGVKRVLCCPVHLFHHGYNLDKAGMTRKFERTTKLLKMDIADDPNDPRPHHFLSASYLSEFMSKEAVEEACKSIALCEKTQAFTHNYFWSLYIAAGASINLGKWEEARGFAEKGIRLFPDHLDSHYVLSNIAYESHDKELFECHFNNFIRIKEIFHKNPEKFGEIVNNTIGSEWLLHLFRAMLLMDEGVEEEARKEIKTAKGLCPDLYPFDMRLGNYFLTHNRLIDAEIHLRKAGETRPNDPWSKKALAAAYENMGRYREQADTLEQALKLDNADSVLLNSLGLCYMKMGHCDKAEAAFSRIIALNPEDFHAVINKAMCLNELERYQEVKPLLQEIKCTDHALKCIILANLAYSLFACGDKKEAADIFHDLEQLDPASLYPPVYLSRISLETMDIESCIRQCDRLTTRLGIKKDLTINSLEDLSFLYVCIARELLILREAKRLIKECLEISLILSNNNPPLLADIGDLFIKTGSADIGSEILKSALLLSSPNDKTREKINEILKSHTSIIDAASGAGPSPL